MKVLILYYSKTGHTLEAANAISDGIKSGGSTSYIVSVDKFKSSILKKYDAIIVGSPCWAGVVSKNGVASPVTKTLNTLKGDSLKGKIGGGFAIEAIGGGISTVTTLGNILTSKGCDKYIVGPIAKAGTVLSISKGHSVSKEDLEHYKTYGAEFSK
jgi:multimeric flavodoxin WrbA